MANIEIQLNWLDAKASEPPADGVRLLLLLRNKGGAITIQFGVYQGSGAFSTEEYGPVVDFAEVTHWAELPYPALAEATVA